MSIRSQLIKAPQRAVGIEGFVNGTNFELTAVGQTFPGGAGGFFASVLVRVLSVPANSIVLGTYPFAATGGWMMQDPGSGMVFRVVNGAGALVSSPLSLTLAGDIGETILFTGVFDATASLVRMYRSGVEVGSGTAIVGYTAPGAGDRASLGSGTGGSLPASWARIVGALYGTGIPTAANILAHYAACKSQGGMALMPGTVTNVNRWQAYQNVPAATSWADDISGMVLTKTGTLTSVPFTPRWERASYGVEGFVSSTNYLRSAVGQLLPGDTGGFYFSIAAHVLSIPAATQYLAFAGGGSTGWTAYTLSGGNTYFTIYNGVGAFVSAPVTSLAAGDVGEVIMLTGVYDSVAGKVRMYRAGVEAGSGTAIVGYTPQTAGGRAALGSNDTGAAAGAHVRILGALYGTGIPSAADITAHYNACKANGKMVQMGGTGVTNVQLWDAEDNVPNAATWTAKIGGMVLTKTGTLTTPGFAPVFE